MPLDQRDLGQPAPAENAFPPLKQKAVTLYAIIYFKIAKGLGFILLALFLYKQAGSNAAAGFSGNDIKDLPRLVIRLRTQTDPVSAFLWNTLSDPERAQLSDFPSSTTSTNEIAGAVTNALNKLVEGDTSFYDTNRFKGVFLRSETTNLLNQAPVGRRQARLNRLLLEDAFPTELSRNHSSLPKEFDSLMQAPVTRWVLDHFRIHPDSLFFINLASQIGALTESNVHRLALGSLLLSLFPLVEGIGMLFRVSWAGWLAIGESAFFIPIEVHALLNPQSRYLPSIIVVTVINIIIVWYLYANRNVLFRHHVPRRRAAKHAQSAP